MNATRFGERAARAGMVTVLIERALPTNDHVMPSNSYVRNESLVGSMKATRFGESVARAALFEVNEMLMPLPTCVHVVPLNSYTRRESLVESMNATRFGERAARAGVLTVAMLRPLPI